MQQKQKAYLTVSEIAALEDVSGEAVRLWIKAGDLEAYKINPNRRNSAFRIKREEYERFLSLREGGNDE